MWKGHRLAVVVPAYNEEQFISGVLKAVPSYVDNVVVVDDCSTDQTSRVVTECDDDRVILLRTPCNQGVGGAILTGHRKALELGNEILVVMAGDGQMDPAYLPLILDAIVEDGYDYAKGNRFLARQELSRMPRVRRFGNIVLSILTKVASGYWNVSDPQNGYTAIKADVFRALPLDKIHKRYFFENDLLVHLNIRNFRVKDVPIPARYGRETSGIRIANVALTFPVLLLKRLFYRMWRKHVVEEFSLVTVVFLVGCLLLLWGSAWGAYALVQHFSSPERLSIWWLRLAVFPLIGGLLFFGCAIVLDARRTPR